MKHFENLLNRFNEQMLTRRQMIQACAVAAASAAVPAFAADAGLKAVWANHYTYVAPDLKKTRDWYHEVYGMQIGHEEAKLSHMWFGDKGGDTLMIIRQANPGEAAPRVERFSFTVATWDKKAIEAELVRRGLQPKSDGDKGFWIKDPDGLEFGLFAKDYIKRPAPKAEKPALWRALSVNHTVNYAPDYRKTADWYKDLLGLRETHDSKRDTYQWYGDSVWIPTALREGGKTSAALSSLDHVAYTIEGYRKEAVEAELNRRNLNPKVDTDLSFNCVDVNGFKMQVCDRELVPVAEKRPPRGGGF
jgi:catechol 2,3-dioxygenase-like lactoylglutathione lyase family enzyme